MNRWEPFSDEEVESLRDAVEVMSQFARWADNPVEAGRQRLVDELVAEGRRRGFND